MSRRSAVIRNRLDRDSDGCPICGVSLAGGGKIRHLQEHHPAYWHAFVVRMASPWVFLALMFALALGGAPGWSFVAVLLGFICLSLWAHHRSIVERGQQRGRLRVGEWLQGAGIGFIMMSFALIVGAVVVVLTR